MSIIDALEVNSPAASFFFMTLPHMVTGDASVAPHLTVGVRTLRPY